MTTTDHTAARDLLARHRATLDQALATIRSRGYWSAYPEIPSGKVYGETANDDGKAAFEARLGRPFEIDQPGTLGRVGAERSPFGIPIGITYPKAELGILVPAARAAATAWSNATVDERTGIALEMLARLNRASFEIAYATMHTTGQAFMMAFQAGGPHAQDRGLEAVAYAYDAMRAVPEHVVWEKPQGKNEPLRLEKRYRVVGRGVGVVVASSTFPNWNSYPGLFASLVTGNAVIVKPHPAAILPLAITVAIARDVLREAGFDPNIVTLVADEPGAAVTKDLVTRPEVAIVDYTGSSAFGEWLEKNVNGLVFTEKAGVNTVVVDSTNDWKGLTRNLALSISLYSGQMCTTPQDIFIPRDGIETDQGHLSFDQAAEGIAKAVDGLLGPAERAVEILGAIATDATLERLEGQSGLAHVILPSRAVEHPQFPQARVRTPLIATLDAARDRATYDRELFGPIAFIVATDSTADALRLAGELARERGAITAVVYTTSDEVVAQAEQMAVEGGVSLAFNLTGALVVNQSSAFSDYHVTGANPAGNASLTDAAFVAARFRVVQTRTPASAAATA